VIRKATELLQIFLEERAEVEATPQNRDATKYYSDLVRKLARRAPHGWARVKADIDYFVTQLLRIREIGRSRFLVIIRTYIFLLDQQAVGFATIDRMNAQLTSLYERLGAAESREAAPETAGASMCQKCKQKGLHKGADVDALSRTWMTPLLERLERLRRSNVPPVARQRLKLTN
jgi:hypothetical protein